MHICITCSQHLYSWSMIRFWPLATRHCGNDIYLASGRIYSPISFIHKQWANTFKSIAVSCSVVAFEEWKCCIIILCFILCLLCKITVLYITQGWHWNSLFPVHKSDDICKCRRKIYHNGHIRTSWLIKKHQQYRLRRWKTWIDDVKI